jgi:hypothetical protein
MKKSFFAFGIIICLVFYFLSTIGWWGYEKWKPRRSTFGNIKESVDRKVFIRKMNYTSSLELKNFNVYIERGFRYGYFSSEQTRLLKNDKFPFQLCYNQIEIDTINNYSFESNINTPYDSISVLFLKNPKLEKEYVIKISKLVSKKWDSIGYIKVWDKDVVKK